MTPYRIPFNRASMTGLEARYLQDALTSGQISGDGPFTRRCHALLESKLGIGKALLTTSCTHALEMAALLLEIRPGDEVLVPSFTFVSTINAFVLRGAIPIFCDVRPDTFNLDESTLESRITSRTKAILVVHYAGVACEMEAIMALAGKHGITVVEDAAHGLWGGYHGRPLGSFAPLATVSFHETKNISCGEGGALLVNDPALVARAEILREKGTNRTRFWRGEIDKYTWVDLGSSYLPSDLLAACLLGQLERAEQIQADRKRLWLRYAEQLDAWAHATGTRLPIVPGHCEQAYHMFYLIMPEPACRDSLIAHLKSAGILATFHYVPLHLSPMGERFGGKPGDCPVTELAGQRLLRLPFYTSMTEQEQDTVIHTVLSWSRP